ncbi:hypothetical protein [Priestia megaterium]|uniref:hypothetical protein n=1 Tax=Priestia megaterium TaxID=1404 RepID=UPI002854F28A|nr:hypothetical protein [Priestia megaterium]MDR7240978.1 putative Mn2+ efflux pump MntP [Priestia megaterium]
MNDTTKLLVVIIILGFQHFFSTRNNKYFGAILPVGYTLVMTWFFINNQFEKPLAFILYLLLGLAFLLSGWKAGRSKYRKDRENELNKMKTRDI